jgi:hypothetical protein
MNKKIVIPNKSFLEKKGKNLILSILGFNPNGDFDPVI